MRLIVFLFPFLLFSLISIAQEKGGWKVVKVRDGQKLNEVANPNTDFTISIKQKKFSGYVGCNKFHGKLEYIEGDSISPITVSSTKIACPDYIDGLENAVLEALHLSDKLVIKGNIAEFYNQTRLVLVLERKY